MHEDVLHDVLGGACVLQDLLGRRPGARRDVRLVARELAQHLAQDRQIRRHELDVVARHRQGLGRCGGERCRPGRERDQERQAAPRHAALRAMSEFGA